MTKEDVLKEKYRKMNVKAEFERSFPEAFLDKIVEKIVEVENPKDKELIIELEKLEAEKVEEIEHLKAQLEHLSTERAEQVEARLEFEEENKTLKSKISKFDNEITKLKKALAELTTQ